MKLKSLLIIGVLVGIPTTSFGGFLFGNKKTVYVPVQQKKESRFADWKKRWTCSEYTALISGTAFGAAALRCLHDIGSEGRSGLQEMWGNVGYGISTVVTGIPRYILTGNIFGDKDVSWGHNFFGSSAVSSLLTVGICGAVVAAPLFLRSPFGYAYRAKWNLDLIESYYLNKSDDLLRSISVTQKKTLEKKLAHVRRMLVLSLPGVGVTKVIDKPWLPTYNSEKTAKIIQELRHRYMQYANRLIAVVPHLSVEFGF